MARKAELGTVQTSTRTYAPGEHLFYQGDPGRGVHRIRKGTVTVYRVFADGYRQIEAFAGPGEYVALCLSSTSPTSAEALTYVETEHVTRTAFERQILEDATFRADVYRLIDKASADAWQQAGQLACRCAKQRVAAFVLFLESRFEEDEDGYTQIPMSRCDMADHLGLTLETVSRMLNQLKQRGMIDLPRPDRFRVLERRALRDLTGNARQREMNQRQAV